MKKYHHLAAVEREHISMLRQSKRSIAEIAVALGRSKSTVSRELRRNQSRPGQYWPDTAQKFALSRRRRGNRLDRDETLKDFVLTKLCCHYWTPEQIAGYLKHRQKKIRFVA